MRRVPALEVVLMRKGICCAGNIIVDITYPIETWPRQNELTHITNGIQQSTGGSVCNTAADLARLDPAMPLSVSGIIGNDPEGDYVLRELGRYPNIDLSMIRRSGRTSFTAVMSNNQTKERTFFQHAGANAEYGSAHIDWDQLEADIFHIGYILLLPALDAPDGVYGTQMARLLHQAQMRGMKTSIDIVSETGERFQQLVRPALRYTDYCIINEIEAQQTTGIPLRSETGTLYRENLRPALEMLRTLGVSAWAVIHCPELGCGLDQYGRYVEAPSLELPDGYIKGAVGAGDAFCAGVLYAAESEWPLPEALRLGACTAAGSLSGISASEGVGSAADMLALFQKYGGKRL